MTDFAKVLSLVSYSLFFVLALPNGWPFAVPNASMKDKYKEVITICSLQDEVFLQCSVLVIWEKLKLWLPAADLRSALIYSSVHRCGCISYDSLDERASRSSS